MTAVATKSPAVATRQAVEVAQIQAPAVQSKEPKATPPAVVDTVQARGGTATRPADPPMPGASADGTAQPPVMQTPTTIVTADGRRARVSSGGRCGGTCGGPVRGLQPPAASTTTNTESPTNTQH